MPDKIFFSYSRVDSAFVLKLANDLRNAGANIWLDQLDIPPGAHWDNEIEAALNSSTCVLAIISPRSMESNNAMDEISYALEQNKKVIPVLLTNTETSFRLRRLQRIDFTGEYEKGIEQLLKAVQVSNDTTDKTVAPGTPDAQAETKHSFTDGYVFGKKQFEKIRDHPLSEKLPSHAMKGQSDINSTQKLGIEAQENEINCSCENNTQAPTKNLFKKGHYKKLYGLITLAAVASCVAVTWGVMNATRQHAGIATQRETRRSLLASPTTDSVKEVKEATPVSSRQEDKMQAQANTQLYPHNTKATVRSKPEQVQKNIKRRIDITASEQKTEEQLLNATNKSTEILPDEQPEIVSQPAAPKEILINSEIIFEVAFQQLPDMEFKRSEQPVKFVVLSPVVYNETTLINKGAIAEGKVVLGKIHSTMFIYNVRGANDQLIPLKEKRSNIPMKEIKLNQPYKARIKKGIRMIFDPEA